MDFAGALRTYLTARGLQTSILSSLREMELLYFADLPSLVLVEVDQALREQGRFLSDPATSHIPVICYSPDELTVDERLRVLERGAVDCLGKPLDPREILLRVKNLLSHTAAGNLHPSMVSIPGSGAAAVRLQRLLEDGSRKWALMWTGLNHLTLFNLAYGYSAGNEALRTAASALMEGLRAAGHRWDAAYWVGGEDFALFTTPDRAMLVAQAIFAVFDQRVAGLFSPGDREAGFFTFRDRRGEVCQSPLLSLSMGVVSNDQGRFHAPLEVWHIAEEVRAKARRTLGNSVYVNKRKKA